MDHLTRPNNTTDDLDLIQSLVVTMDILMKVVYANETACAVLGFHKDDLIGRGWPESFFSTIDSDWFKANFQRIPEIYPISSKRIFQTYRRDQEMLPVEWHYHVLRTDDRIVGLMMVGAILEQ